MQTKYIIANWKAYLNPKQSLDLFREISNIQYSRLVGGQAIFNINLIVCPSFIVLSQINSIISAKGGSAIHLGAQDCFYKDRGAYTGEISPADLKELGCEYVIIGHSERRQYLYETDELIQRKLQAAVTAGLTPILCVSDTKADRDWGQSEKKVIAQLRSDIGNLKLKRSQHLLIAYEPVWALSSTKNSQHCDPLEAERMITLIKRELACLHVANASALYGGSVDETNVEEYLSQPEIGGVLVGGASTSRKSLFAMLEKIRLKD